MIAIFAAQLEREFQADVAERTRLHGADAPASLLPRTDAQRRFDAVQAIFRKSVVAPADGRRPTHLVNVIVDQRTFEEGLAAHGLLPFPHDLPATDFAERRCETDTGINLLPDDVVLASLQGHVRRVVMNSAGVVIEMGRKQRLFTGAAREAAKLMATNCDHPGCDVAGTFAQVDHVIEWSDDGPTDPENSSLACGRHNPTKHTHYRVKRTERGHVIYHRRDGTPMLAVGRRHPDTLPPERAATDRTRPPAGQGAAGQRLSRQRGRRVRRSALRCGEPIRGVEQLCDLGPVVSSRRGRGRSNPTARDRRARTPGRPRATPDGRRGRAGSSASAGAAPTRRRPSPSRRSRRRPSW
jgi:hypothetical protein